MKYGRITDYFAKLVLAVLLSFSLIYPLTTTLAIPYKHYTIAGISLAVILILSIISINKKVFKFSLICIFSSLVLTLLYLFIKDILFYAYDPIIWLINYIRGLEPFNQSHSTFITILFCIGLSSFVFIFTFIKFNFPVMTLSGVVLFTSQRIFDFFVAKAYIAFCIFCISILAYYFLHIYYKKSNQNADNIVTPSGLLLFILPIATLIILLTNSIPVSSKPIEWKWMDSKIQKVYNNFTFKFGNENKFNVTQNIGEFSLASIGFGDSTSLGGNIKLDNTKVLEVKSYERIYLRGRSSNHYENNNWSSTYKTSQGSPLEEPIYVNGEKYYVYAKSLYVMNLNQLLAKAYPDLNNNYNDLENFSSSRDISITYHDIKTTSIFTPLNPLYFRFDKDISEDQLIFDDEDIFSSTLTFEKDCSYSLNSYLFDTDSEVFKNILRQSSDGFYSAQLEETLKEITNLTLSTTHKNLTDFFKATHVQDVDEQGNLQLNTPITNDTAELDNTYVFNIIQSSHDHQLEVFKSSDDIVLKYINVDDMSELELLIASCFSDAKGIKHELNQYSAGLWNILQEYLFKEFIDYGYPFEFFKGHSKTLYLDLFSAFKNYLYHRSSILYLDFVFDNYTFIPDTVPARVHQLAHEITKNEENNFDKVKAIETYLSENYYYTLLPGKVPEERDFVDYFLFDSQEGYCAYFATAMAILTRCLDIPSRYVEGYRLPSETIEEYLYEVRNTEAHAWVEVFFEGIGWVTFEPTATYNYTFYNQGSTPPPYLLNQMQPGNRPSNYSPNNYNNTNQPFLDGEKTSKKPLNIHLILTILFVLLIFSLILAFNMLRRKIKLRKIYKLDARECIIKLFEEYLKYLKFIKKPVIGGETPLEYAKRIDTYGYFHPHSFSEIANLFVKARYSQLEITNQDKELVYKFYKHTLDIIPKKTKLRYLFTIL